MNNPSTKETTSPEIDAINGITDESMYKGTVYADSLFLDWVNARLGKSIEDLLKAHIIQQRRWMIGNGDVVSKIRLDELANNVHLVIKGASSDKSSHDDFDTWFDGSKVTDSDGLPLTVYHGTMDVFDEFRTNSEGICFAESRDHAKFYATLEEGSAARIIYANLLIQNPLKMTWREWLGGVTDIGINHNLEGFKGIKKRGYDGFLLTEPDKTDPAASSTTYVVFHPNQIRQVMVEDLFAYSSREMINNEAMTLISNKNEQPVILRDFLIQVEQRMDAGKIDSGRDALTCIIEQVAHEYLANPEINKDNDKDAYKWSSPALG